MDKKSPKIRVRGSKRVMIGVKDALQTSRNPRESTPSQAQKTYYFLQDLANLEIKLRKRIKTICKECGRESIFKFQKEGNNFFLVCPKKGCDYKIFLDDTWMVMLRRDYQRLLRDEFESKRSALQNQEPE